MALPTSTGGWTVPAGNVKGVDTGRFWIETGLAAGQTRQVRFQSYDSTSQNNPSALGPAIAGTTIGNDVPIFDAQPVNASVFSGNPVEFSVSARSQRGETLSFQWYYLDVSDTAYAEWKPIVGATGPDYRIERADTRQSGSLYCVDAMDQTTNASGVVPTVRSQPARLYVEPSSTANDPSAAAATLRTAPTISLELTYADGSAVLRHRDEFFVSYGDGFDMTFTVKDAAGKPCVGSLSMSVYTYENDLRKSGNEKSLYLVDGSNTIPSENPSTNDMTWPLTPSGSQQARVFQIDVRFSPGSPTVDTVLPINELFILNYGMVNLERAAHFLTCDTNGFLPSGSKYALSRFMPLPDIAPAMVGARFEGWFTDADLANPLDSILPLRPRETSTLFSAWAQDEYMVTYELDGGSNNADNPSSLTNDSTTIALRDPSKTGFAFEGWFADQAFTESVTTIPRGATGDIDLYAKWKLIEYPLFYFAGTGKNPAGNPVSHTVLDGDLAVAPPEFDEAVAGTSAWYADSLLANKAPSVIPAGSTGDEAFYGHADFAQPEPAPEPGPTPTPEPDPAPTPGSTDPSQPKPLVKTGDKQGLLHLFAVAAVTAGAALAASFGFRATKHGPSDTDEK